ncbi:N-acetyltransferase B complex non catalytic subunit-domain-containing protein [Stachybotrys elegans]|uniref:N-acetyltransferase B complex non catalytic subunit-domain-containing protein n=1 Tax=Stachybotrys elegans TaxID=80388 RepID=A0A8K0WNN2_9HYPO|nr:N-acetyltransferase B complex non catalytic subunit-domain-containing protein [Stachybotrys elegans]
MTHWDPYLKNGVDMQLQTAFEERNWPVVARLAERRARTLNDQYYEVLKICAQSQLDDPQQKYAAVEAVEQYIKDGTVIKDRYALHLLEYATWNLTADTDYFERMLGPLRVRAVKAAPKDRTSAMFCLEECILRWDLNSAQQMSPQAPPEKKKLYGTLALKQIERAAQLTEQTHGEKLDAVAKVTTRSIQTEDEIYLLHDIVEKHGTPADLEKLMTSSIFSPLAQLRLGRKGLLLRVASRLQKEKKWEELYNIFKDCMKQKDENGEPSLLVYDVAMWKFLITAAQHRMAVDPDVRKTVKDIIDDAVKSKFIRGIYQTNLRMAQVSCAFNLSADDGNDLVDGKVTSNRMRVLLDTIRDAGHLPSCFNDIKEFLEQLDPPAMAYAAYDYVPSLVPEAKHDAYAVMMRLLSLKMAYFISSCPSIYTPIARAEPKFKCAVCDAEISSPSCNECLQKIQAKALELHSEIRSNPQSSLLRQAETLSSCALVMAFCSIRLSALERKSVYSAPAPGNTRHILRALLILEQQAASSPKDSVVCLYLAQLHSLFASGRRARQHWDTLGVKRAIVDSMAPHFFDRASHLAPALLLASEDKGRELTFSIQSAYGSLMMPMPKKLIEAFESASYMSILSMPPYIANLRHGCTRALTLAEEARSGRLIGSQLRTFHHDLRHKIITDELELPVAADYGIFPAWDCSSAPQTYTLYRPGPPLSACRVRLSVLTEAFHHAMTFKPDVNYKGLPVATGADQTYLIETLTRIHNSMNKFLPSARDVCTPSEMIYFEVVSLVSLIIPLCTGPERSKGLLKVLEPLAEAAEAGLATLNDTLPTLDSADVSSLVAGFRSLNQLILLKDTATALCIASKWILSFSERKTERDASGRNLFSQAVLARVKQMLLKGDESLKEAKAWMLKLHCEVAAKPGFNKRFQQWVFEDAEELKTFVGDEATNRLLDSVKHNLEAWQQTKWD